MESKTDDSGGFEFTRLPAGQYFVLAHDLAHLPAIYPEFARTVRGGPNVLRLADGQVLDRLIVTMHRGGAFAGRVTDARGNPISGRAIAVRVPPRGVGRPDAVKGADLNESGEYRIWPLDPGPYALLVVPKGEDPSLLPTFFPDALASEQARLVTVEPDVTAYLDVQVFNGPTALVKGTLFNVSGRPAGGPGAISFLRIIPDIPSATRQSTATLKPDGSFEIRLALGQYAVEPGVSDTETSTPATLDVGQDIAGLVVQRVPRAKLSGRVVFAGTHPVPAVSSDARTLSLSPTAGRAMCHSGAVHIAPDWTFTIDGVSGTCVPHFNGRAGPWFLELIAMAGRDVTAEPITIVPGEPVPDVEIVMTDQRAQVRFHVTDSRGTPTQEYAGIVFAVDRSKWRDRARRYITWSVPGSELAVETSGGAVHRGGPSVWASVFQALRSLLRIPKHEGGDVIGGIPAGDYYVIAVEDVAYEDLSNPRFLEQLSRVARRIRVSPGALVDVNLRRIRPIPDHPSPTYPIPDLTGRIWRSRLKRQTETVSQFQTS
jgi:hypothetical protein